MQHRVTAPGTALIAGLTVLLTLFAPTAQAAGSSVTTVAAAAARHAGTGLHDITAGSRVGPVTAADPANSAVADNGSAGAVLTVLHNGATRARFTVTGDLTMIAGTVTVTAGGSELYADQPWAVDATGKNLRTHYRVTGHTITQIVNTKGATYPVVADPSFKLCDLGLSVCVKTGHSETSRISDAFFAGLGAATGTFCGLIPWSPWYVAAIKAGCAGMVAAYWLLMRQTFKTAQTFGDCVQLKFPLGSAFPYSWKRVSC